MEVNPVELTSVLLWIIAGPGAAWFVGQLVSLLAEHVPFWHKLKPTWKLVITLVLAGAIPIGAQFLYLQPDFLAVVGPYFTIAMSGIIAWLGMQNQYLKIKDTTYAAKFNPKNQPNPE